MTIGLNFATVLDAARTGADWAWTSLYRDLAPAVLGYLRAHGAREAEDLTQEIFLAVVRGLADFDGDEDGFRSWVFVIAHRRLLDERRSRARHPVDSTPDHRLDRPDGDVENEALENIGIERVIELLDELSEDQRDALMLRIVGGLTASQVAPVIGKSPGAVKQLQRRGLRTLARLLSKQPVPR